jgi:hypothetical protein
LATDGFFAGFLIVFFAGFLAVFFVDFLVFALAVRFFAGRFFIFAIDLSPLSSTHLMSCGLHLA